MHTVERKVRQIDWVPVIIIGLSFVLALFLAFKHRGDSLAGLIDEAEYHRLALGLLDGLGYDSTYWLPGFPAFIALIYAVVGPRLAAVYAAHAVLWAVCLALVYRISFLITQSRPISLLTLALCTLWWPFCTNMVPRMRTEMLASVLMAASVYAVLSAIRSGARPVALVAGVLLAATALTKSVAAILIPLAALYLLFAGKDLKRQSWTAALLLIGSLFVIAPWTVRNYNATQSFVPISTGAGLNFWFGNHPEVFSRRVVDICELSRPISKQLKDRDAVQRDKVFFRVGAKTILEDPARAASIFLQKFSKMWLGELGMNPATASEPTHAIGGFGFPRGCLSRTLLFIVALMGWFSLSVDVRKRAAPIGAMLAAWTLVYVALTTEPRYAYPVQFYEIMFAAAGVRAAILRIGARLSPAR